MVDLEIIVVNFNTKDLTLDTLRSINTQKWRSNIKILVVDNGSTDGSVEAIKKAFPDIELSISEKNLGFSKGNNLGLRKTSANLVLLLNSDTIVLPGSLDNLVEYTNSHPYGIVSCKLLNSDGTFQPNGGKIPTFINTFLWLSGLDDILGLNSYHSKDLKYFQNSEVGWVGGTAMLIKREVIEKVGLLDENIFMYGEDVEYCLRAKRHGFKIGWTDKSKITHLGGGSLDQPQFRQWLGEFKGILYIYQKYYGVLPTIILRFLIYLFVIIRSLAFLFLGKLSISKTYAKVAYNI